MDPDWDEYWAKARKKGQLQFIAQRGTLLGLIMFGLMVVLPRLFDMVESDKLPIAAFCISMLLGYTLGYALWWANERSFKKKTDK